MNTLNINRAKLDKIRAKHGLELILLHGSQVSERTHKDSDIDIAVLPKRNKKVDVLGLYADLGEVIKPEDKIDITNLSHADPLLLFTVTSKSNLLSGNDKTYKLLKIKAFNMYNDYEPYFAIEQKTIYKNLTNYVAN